MRSINDLNKEPITEDLDNVKIQVEEATSESGTPKASSKQATDLDEAEHSNKKRKEVASNPAVLQRPKRNAAIKARDRLYKMR